MLAVGRNGGSVVSLIFKSADRPQEVKPRVRAMDKELPGAWGNVWLDVEKSKREMKPARAIHRALDQNELLEETQTTLRKSRRSLMARG